MKRNAGTSLQVRHILTAEETVNVSMIQHNDKKLNLKSEPSPEVKIIVLFVSQTATRGTITAVCRAESTWRRPSVWWNMKT